MARILSHIATLLLMATAVSSCSAGTFEPSIDGSPESEGISKERSILITGVVSDNSTSALLEGISINIKVYPQDDPSASPIASEEVYSDNRGIFIAETPGADIPLLCVLTAEDKEGTYESHTKQIIVSWDSPSFDRAANMFIVNDCNIRLNRTED